MEYLFGIDIGGTTVKIGLLDLSGNFIDKWEIPTDRAEKGRHILPDIAKSVLEYLRNNNIAYSAIDGIGFGVPGPVINSVVSQCANLGWENVDVKQEFAKLIPFKTRIVASNDANVAAYGEIMKGGSHVRNAVMFTLGTGVGGGIVIGGQLLDGTNGAAGEYGHMRADFKHNFICNCGLIGCLETVTSATGVVRLAKEFLREDKNSVLSQMESFTAKDVYENAEKGDPLCVKVTNEVAYYLGYAASIMAATVDPERFIIGGGMSRSGDFLLKAVEEQYQKFAFRACKKTPFYLAKLGNDAGMVGAALLAKD